MFTAVQLPSQEAKLRQEKCRQWLAKVAPHVSGMLIFSRTSIYYLTGTRANGILWLPRQGEPVLMVRKAPERCRLESPLQHIVSFKSYSQIAELCAQCGSPLGAQNVTTWHVGAEMRALPWSLASMLEERMKPCSFVDTSTVFDAARYEKTPYELDLLRHCTQQHHKALQEHIPQALSSNMSERAVAHMIWDKFFALGHGGMLRQDRYNTNLFLGDIAAGANALYPGIQRSAVGSVGEHPSMPYMGYAGSLWKKGQSLIIDTGFMHEGYHSHAAATYFAGTKEEIPQSMHTAYTFCINLLKELALKLTPGASLAKLWYKAQLRAEYAGYASTFMGEGGLNRPSAPPLGSSLGMSMEEWPALTSVAPHINQEEVLCKSGTVFSLGAFVALPHLPLPGMVGIQAVYEITESGAQCLTPFSEEIICIS